MIRLHVPGDLAAGLAVGLSPEASHYLAHVMRKAVGDEVLLFNGRDGEWRARVAQLGKRGLVLHVETLTRIQTIPQDLDLLVAVVKRARLETIVEKATELGCRRVRLVLTRRTNADRVRIDRLQAIAIEAAEQTGRLETPEIVAPETLERVLDGWEAGRRLMFCDEGGVEGWGTPSLLPLWEKVAAKPTDEGSLDDAGERIPSDSIARRDPSSGPVGHFLAQGEKGAAGPWAVLIGPEGGFDPAERARLRSLPFVTAVGLGPRILRADTAAISALTLWQATLGDWRTPDGGT
jgi:16S rRNA (uracil1498-N3)-methyltransferase